MPTEARNGDRKKKVELEQVVSASDPAAGWGGGGHEIYELPLAAIFFMTYLYGSGGGDMAPSAPALDPLLCLIYDPYWNPGKSLSHLIHHLLFQSEHFTHTEILSK